MRSRKKKALKALLGQLEVHPLPDKQKILSRCETAFSEQRVRKKETFRRARPMRGLLAAVISVLLLVSCLSVYAVADESREYREAISFFEQYALSAEGYSRKEIKLIYQDIVSGSFTYEKTAGAIEARVGGYEIFQDTPTPEELKQLWSYKDASPNGTNCEGFDVGGEVAANGVSYRYKNQVRYVETADEAYVILEKYRNGSMEWSKTLSPFSVEEMTYTADYVVCIGTTPSGYAVKMLSSDGEELWQKSIRYSPRKLIAEADGVTVICSDAYDFRILFYGLQGQLTVNSGGRYATLLGELNGSYSFCNAEKLGENYVIQLRNDGTADFLIKINRQGELLEVFRYALDTEEYYFTDVVEYCGNLYLSGYAVPKRGGEHLPYGEELNALKEQIKAEGQAPADSEVLSLLREQYTAMLMRCDRATGQVQAFYSVDGALGGRFLLDEQSNLVWQVESLADVSCKLEQSAWGGREVTVSFTGICAVHAYAFDWRGFFLGERQSETAVRFER